jgi:trehalose/maltose hydrolase-like predicted phosphorylase
VKSRIPQRAWRLTYRGFHAEEEGLREALCALGNGYFVTRAAAPEASADEVHYPGTYLAGCYNRLTTEVSGRPVENEDLVNVPNWLPLTFRIEDGAWFHLSRVKVQRYRLELDMRSGILTRFVAFRDDAGRQTEVTQRRLVHMGDKNVAALETVIVARNWSGRITILAALDGTVANAGVPRYSELDGRHLVPLSTRRQADDSICMVVETRQSAWPLMNFIIVSSSAFSGIRPWPTTMLISGTSFEMAFATFSIPFILLCMKNIWPPRCFSLRIACLIRESS